MCLRGVAEKLNHFRDKGILCDKQLWNCIGPFNITIVVVGKHSELKLHWAILGTKFNHILKTQKISNTVMTIHIEKLSYTCSS